MMVSLWSLSVMLYTICAVYGVYDQKCFDDVCSCCVERVCGHSQGFPNGCLKGCIDGHRGARCYELCQYENCKSCGGNYPSKDCTECYDGYYLGSSKDCTSQCPSNCKSCTSSTLCTECKEGFYDKDMSTTCKYAYCPENCECNDGQGDCVSCKAGYFDTSTSCIKQCPVNCLTCESEESCNECKNGFYNGHEYDNNSNLQLNNCTYKCRDRCTQCQSYNTCLQCTDGKYGQTCQENCSVGCKDRTCLFDSGQCTCTEEFTGDRCMKCIDGQYGLLCNEACSKYCKGNICERTSGQCTDGCITENMSGYTCNSCKVGRFDELCDKICPENCKDIKCERNSGKCSDGCISNYNGTTCDVCIQGKFGRKCDLNCPINCAGNSCDRDSGKCFDCDGSFQGETCDRCRSGYYGPNCDVPCSPHCSSLSCNSNSGICVSGCNKGFSGDKCCAMSENCVECLTNNECRKCVPGFFKTSCNETCLGFCGHACDISTGACIASKEEQEQKDASNSGLVAALAVLGSVFTLVVAANILLFALVILKKITISQKKTSQAKREPTYENQLKSVDEQLQRPKRDEEGTRQSEDVEGNVYEGISCVNENEHEYQKVSNVRGNRL